MPRPSVGAVVCRNDLIERSLRQPGFRERGNLYARDLAQEIRRESEPPAHQGDDPFVADRRRHRGGFWHLAAIDKLLGDRDALGLRFSTTASAESSAGCQRTISVFSYSGCWSSRRPSVPNFRMGRRSWATKL
jgi:hypothetical protein